MFLRQGPRIDGPRPICRPTRFLFAAHIDLAALRVSSLWGEFADAFVDLIARAVRGGQVDDSLAAAKSKRLCCTARMIPEDEPYGVRWICARQYATVLRQLQPRVNRSGKIVPELGLTPRTAVEDAGNR